MRHADREVVEATESSELAAEGLAAVDGPAAGAQAVLEALTEQARRPDPPEPAGP